MDICISNSPEETEQFGSELAARLVPGNIVALIGDLGAGKTALTRGILRGLGYTGKVASPTFGLVNLYNTNKGEVAHLDLYRLNSAEDIVAAGLADYLESPIGISIVEWADRWSWQPNEKLITLHLQTTTETSREIIYEDPRA